MGGSPHNSLRLSGRTTSETAETERRIRRTTCGALALNVRSDAAAGYAAHYGTTATASTSTKYPGCANAETYSSVTIGGFFRVPHFRWNTS